MRCRAALAAACLAVSISDASICAEPAPPAASATSQDEPLFKGLGPLHHRVTTQSRRAQKYFDQGLAFMYAFNHDEATRSFQQAAKLDPNLSMAYWGIALSLGPNINLPEDAQRGKQAFDAIQKAELLKASATEPERAYIDALAERYTADGKMTEAQQRAYAEAMRQVWRHHTDDPDAGALFAESLMDLHPWNLWTQNGKPAEGTLEAVSTLEEVLRKHPDHVGANHYYIHAVEASPHPERALASAKRLGELAPAAGHLVHMPSHIYFRVGDYHGSAEANEDAVNVDESYILERHPSGAYPTMYYTHNIQFLLVSCMMEGDRHGSAATARTLASVVTPEMVRAMPMAEFLLPWLYFAEARFNEWDTILKEPAPPPDLKYTTGMWHYARGLAFTAKGQRDDSDAELRQLDAIESAMPPERVVGFNSAKHLLNIASETLAGEIDARREHRAGALAHLERAVALQDSLSYEEPPAWYYPVRETLGTEMIKQGKVEEARAVFREDLVRNPYNGRSLHGLLVTLRASKKDREADEVEEKFRKAWQHADVNLADAHPPETSAASR